MRFKYVVLSYDQPKHRAERPDREWVDADVGMQRESPYAVTVEGEAFDPNVTYDDWGNEGTVEVVIDADCIEVPVRVRSPAKRASWWWATLRCYGAAEGGPI
jgi:hypothetical protein